MPHQTLPLPYRLFHYMYPCFQIFKNNVKYKKIMIFSTQNFKKNACDFCITGIFFNIL